jgi:hypothetical protein
MTIKVFNDRIEFDEFVLRATPTGFSFNGEIQGKNFFNLFQGTVAGFTAGGHTPPTLVNTIDKFPFPTDANALDVGDLTVTRRYSAGQSSTTHGYTSGGTPPPGGGINTIDKFAFAINANATDVGDLTVGKYSSSGQSSSSQGYNSGGVVPTLSPVAINVIERFPFAADFNSVSTPMTLSGQKYHSAGQSSAINGYVSGGEFSNQGLIEKYPFASDLSVSSVGNLTQSRGQVSGQSSTTHGYTAGGNPNLNRIDKFPFATDANATTVGNLSQSRLVNAGQSSTTNGYASGGYVIPNSVVATIDKFPFATDTNATNVASLSQARGLTGAGTQY